MQNSDNLRLDGHKLFFHPHRVAQWLEGRLISPLYVEISPAGSCNHRCLFCATDFMEYRPRYLDKGILLERLSELAALGVKSIMYAGEGEPLLHPDIIRIIEFTRSVGIDVAMSTNGVLFSPEISRQILPSMSWVKFSIDAGSAEMYSKIHGTKPEDFERVFQNVEAAAKLVSTNGWACTIGAQALLLPDNACEMERLAGKCKDAGARYLVIKPYSQHHKSHNDVYANIDYTPFMDLYERLERFNDSNFSVIFRTHTFAKLQRTDRGYERCHALPFWSYIDSAGNVWGCSSHMGDDRFLYGNITTNGFHEIWAGPQRQRSLDYVASGLNPETCRMNCRMDEINHYLWELTHPSGHVNFI